jgi:hypothetical protein
MKNVFKTTSSFIKIALLVGVVGFTVLGSNFDKSLTGAFLTSSITAINNPIGANIPSPSPSPSPTPEPTRTVSGLKFHDQNEDGIHDSGEDGLQGWTIYAATQTASLTVDAMSTPPVSTPVLASGETYIIRVAGTYFANDNIFADAMYSDRNNSGTWTDSVQNYEGYGPTLLDLQIDGVSPSWGEYNADHTYWIPVVGTGASKSLEIYDLNNGDNNTGSLSVSVYHVFASDVTDDAGNYSITVPATSDTIYVFEQMQSNWLQTLPGASNYYYEMVATDGSITRDFGNVTIDPTGNLQLTKYVCDQNATVSTAQRPDAAGNFAVPANCELQGGARFGYIFQEDKTDNSPPYPGLTDSTPFTPIGGSTNGSGVLLASLIPSEGRYMLAELNEGNQRIADDQLLGFLCTGDSGIYTNNYEATFVPTDGTAYCAVFNRVPDTSVVLNEILPDPQSTDSANMPQGEWVELFNNSSFPIDVNGWVISASSSSVLTVTAGNSDNNGNPFDSGETIVPAGGELVVYRDGSGTFSMNEAGDTINLYNGPVIGSELIDSHTYTGPIAEEKTLARIPDGTGAWVDPIAQPGRPNTNDVEDLEPFVNIWQQDSNHVIIGIFEGLGHTSADYTVTYTRNTTTTPIQEQLQGAVTITNNNLYIFDLFLGTTTTGGTKTHHTDISNVQLDVLLHGGDISMPEANFEGSWAE